MNVPQLGNNQNGLTPHLWPQNLGYPINIGPNDQVYQLNGSMNNILIQNKEVGSVNYPNININNMKITNDLIPAEMIRRVAEEYHKMMNENVVINTPTPPMSVKKPSKKPEERKERRRKKGVTVDSVRNQLDEYRKNPTLLTIENNVNYVLHNVEVVNQIATDPIIMPALLQSPVLLNCLRQNLKCFQSTQFCWELQNNTRVIAEIQKDEQLMKEMRDNNKLKLPIRSEKYYEPRSPYLMTNEQREMVRQRASLPHTFAHMKAVKEGKTPPELFMNPIDRTHIVPQTIPANTFDTQSTPIVNSFDTPSTSTSTTPTQIMNQYELLAAAARNNWFKEFSPEYQKRVHQCMNKNLPPQPSTSTATGAGTLIGLPTGVIPQMLPTYPPLPQITPEVLDNFMRLHMANWHSLNQLLPFLPQNIADVPAPVAPSVSDVIPVRDNEEKEEEEEEDVNIIDVDEITNEEDVIEVAEPVLPSRSISSDTVPNSEKDDSRTSPTSSQSVITPDTVASPPTDVLIAAVNHGASTSTQKSTEGNETHIDMNILVCQPPTSQTAEITIEPQETVKVDATITKPIEEIEKEVEGMAENNESHNEELEPQGGEVERVAEEQMDEEMDGQRSRAVSQIRDRSPSGDRDDNGGVEVEEEEEEEGVDDDVDEEEEDDDGDDDEGDNSENEGEEEQQQPDDMEGVEEANQKNQVASVEYEDPLTNAGLEKEEDDEDEEEEERMDQMEKNGRSAAVEEEVDEQDEQDPVDMEEDEDEPCLKKRKMHSLNILKSTLNNITPTTEKRPRKTLVDLKMLDSAIDAELMNAEARNDEKTKKYDQNNKVTVTIKEGKVTITKRMKRFETNRQGKVILDPTTKKPTLREKYLDAIAYHYPCGQGTNFACKARDILTEYVISEQLNWVACDYCYEDVKGWFHCVCLRKRNINMGNLAEFKCHQCIAEKNTKKSAYKPDEESKRK